MKTYPIKYAVYKQKCTVQLQGLLNHAAERYFKFVDLRFKDNWYTRLTFICKYGFDGTNIETYKLNEKWRAEYWSFLFLFGSTTISWQKKTNIIYWKNPQPSSTRYCRPINIYSRSEIAELSREEESNLKKEIKNLKDFRINGCNIGF